MSGCDITLLPGDCVLASEGRVVIVIDDYLAADDVSRAFGPADGFHDQVQRAMAEAWPHDPEDGER